MAVPTADKIPTNLARYKWQVVGMLWFISFFNYADRQAIFSVFPLLEREMNLDSVQLGYLGSAFAWVYGLGAPMAGWVVDRMRRKTAILGGLQIWSIICMATAFSRNFRHLLLFRALEGAGEAFYFPASNSLISDYHTKQTRSRALGLHQTAVYFGTIAGGFFAGYIGQQYGWRWSFVVFGGLGVLLGVILQKALIEPQRGASDALESNAPIAPQPAEPETGGHGAGLMALLRIPTVVALMLAFLCANFVAVVLLSWMPKFLYDQYKMDLATAGLTATAFAQLASMAGAPTGGWLADRLCRKSPRGRILVQAVAVLLGAPFVALCGLTQSVVWVIVALIAWGFFKGLYDANIFASAFDVVPATLRGRVVGWMNLFGWLAGGGTAPLVIGYMAKSNGLGAAIATASIVYVAAGIILLTAAAFFVSKDAARREATQ